MVIHVSIKPRNPYAGRHEATGVSGISGARYFVFARRPVGIHYVRGAGPALLSRKCRLPNKPSAVRAYAESSVSRLLAGQLSARRTVRLVLYHDERPISPVALVGIRLGRRGLYRNGDTGGISGGHQRDSPLPHAGLSSRCCWNHDWSLLSPAVEYIPAQTAIYLATPTGRE